LDSSVERGTDTSELEGCVDAVGGRVGDRLYDVVCHGIEHDVSAQLSCDLAPGSVGFGDEDLLRAGDLCRLDCREPDRVTPEYADRVAGLHAGALNRVEADSERFDERALPEFDLVGENVDLLFGDDSALGEAASTRMVADCERIHTPVVLILRTVRAVVTWNVRVYCDAVADGDSVHCLAHFADDAAELVADDDRTTRSRLRVLLDGSELRISILVKVGATDSTDLDVDPDVYRSNVAWRDVTVDSDILFSVETCSFRA